MTKHGLEEDEVRWRKIAGEELRRIKGHETDGDPDWSLPEISREAGTFATEFFDWLYAHGGAEDFKGTMSMLDAWIALKWTAPLSISAKGILAFAIIERMKKHVPEPTLDAPPKGADETLLAYVERVAGERPSPSVMPTFTPPKEPPTLPFKETELVLCMHEGCFEKIPIDWEKCPSCAAGTCDHEDGVPETCDHGTPLASPCAACRAFFAQPVPYVVETTAIIQPKLAEKLLDTSESLRYVAESPDWFESATEDLHGRQSTVERDPAE